MKTQKLSLKSIKNVLSRGEMRKIMAGGSGNYNCCNCTDEENISYFVPMPPSGRCGDVCGDYFSFPNVC